MASLHVVLSRSARKAILDRIRAQTDLKESEKQDAVKKVERYWAKRKARAKEDASSSEEP